MDGLLSGAASIAMTAALEIVHRLGLQGACERLEQLARKHDVRLLAEAGGQSGTLEKSIGFLGRVRARYTVAEAHIAIEVLEAPALVPAQTVRRLLEEELGRAFSEREGSAGH